MSKTLHRRWIRLRRRIRVGALLLMAAALALALLVEHAAATGDEATKVAAELWGRARLTADETAVDAHRTFEILCP